jgi:hypothetical protein
MSHSASFVSIWINMASTTESLMRLREWYRPTLVASLAGMWCWEERVGIRACTSERVAGLEWRWDRRADSSSWIREMEAWVDVKAWREETRPCMVGTAGDELGWDCC